MHNLNRCLLLEKDNQAVKYKIDQINLLQMQENLQEHFNPANFTSYDEIKKNQTKN